MKSSWNYKPISEIMDVLTDYVANGSFASLKENVAYSDSGFARVIRLTDYNHDFSDDGIYVSEAAYNFLSKTKLFGNEIIIANVGANVGKIFMSPNLNEPMTLGPNSILLKTKFVDSFYYYYFKSPEGQNRIQSIVTGSAQPKFNKTSFKKLIVPVPDIKEQLDIAKKLNIFDEKIKILKQINDNLLALSMTHFEHWLETTSSKNNVSLDEIATYKNGLAMQKFESENAADSLPVLKIRELNQGFTDSSSNRVRTDINESVKVYDGDVIFSWSGTLLVDIWTDGPAGLNQHLFKVTSATYPKWFYYMWTRYHLRQFQQIAAGKATTMGHIKRSDLKTAKVVIPTDSEFNQLEMLLNPVVDAYIQNGVEIKNLQMIRDQLLQNLLG